MSALTRISQAYEALLLAPPHGGGLGKTERGCPWKIIGALERCLDDKYASVRGAGAKALGNLGERDPRIWSLKAPPEKT